MNKRMTSNQLVQGRAGLDVGFAIPPMAVVKPTFEWWA
jgi:hypothetical protein